MKHLVREVGSMNHREVLFVYDDIRFYLLKQKEHGLANKLDTLCHHHFSLWPQQWEPTWWYQLKQAALHPNWWYYKQNIPACMRPFTKGFHLRMRVNPVFRLFRLKMFNSLHD